MLQRETKSRGELEALTMAEARKYAACENAVAANITATPGPDWGFAFVFVGARHDPQCKMLVEEAIRNLRNEYDLAPDRP